MQRLRSVAIATIKQGASRGQVHRPVHAKHLAGEGAHGGQPLTPALGEDDARHDAAVAACAAQLLQHARRVGQAEGLKSPICQHAAPAVEHHHGLCAGINLRIQIGGHAVGIDGQNAVQQVWSRVEQRLDGAEISARCALHHVARQRPGAAGKADQRHPSGQRLADAAHGVEHIAQAIQVGNGQPCDVGLGAHGAGELGAFAFSEGQAQTHGIGHGEDVAEQNGRIQRITLQRLQGGFGGQVWRGGQSHETACAGAQGAVFGKMTAGLAHEPDGCLVHRQAHAGPQEAVVAQGRERQGGIFHYREVLRVPMQQRHGPGMRACQVSISV